jgi:hypothetical protein
VNLFLFGANVSIMLRPIIPVLVRRTVGLMSEEEPPKRIGA